MDRELKVYILEDETHSRNLLKVMLEEINPNIEFVGFSDNLDKAESDLKRLKFDLAFFDIQVQGRNVFSLLNNFQKLEFKVIFTTAYSEYALNAIKLSAIDYLIKPYTYEELEIAVNKCLVSLDQTISMEALAVNIDKPNKLVVADGSDLKIVSIDQINYLHSDRTYTDIYLADGTKFTSSKSLSHYEKLFTDVQFYRVHHSYLVNLQRIQSFKAKDMDIILENGFAIPVSTRRRSGFIKKLEEVSFN
jgi:two-component system LytT family response regulator